MLSFFLIDFSIIMCLLMIFLPRYSIIHCTLSDTHQRTNQTHMLTDVLITLFLVPPPLFSAR